MDKLTLKQYLKKFSIILVNEDKRPVHLWKECQTKKLTENELENILNDKKPSSFGLITGFEDLEVIDIDLKVFSTAKEKKEFFEEFIGYLRDNIYDFDTKVSIYKTKNEGFHLLYKSKRVEGNLKLAKLKGHKEAVIETRGIGGYVFAYPENCVNGVSYFGIDYISDDDREVIMTFARMYDHVESAPQEPKKEVKVYQEADVPSWVDFNNNTSIWGIIQEDFTIVAELSKKYVIKRHGATSPHSGYIFKDSGCMYLFSTGTIYPHEQLITPFLAYTWKNHHGDTSESARQLYKDGYGTRLKSLTKSEAPENEEALNDYLIDNSHLRFPIEIFPEPIQHYLVDCRDKLDSNIDYMGCSLLWLISVCIGNSIELKVKNGWTEKSNIWLSVVGRAGVGKTPSINNIVFPLMKINSRLVKDYQKKVEDYDNWNSLDAKDKKNFTEPEKPNRTQLIANDITLEALVMLHQDSDNAIGVFKDELAGWLKDMNKYRAGSDLEFWLSSWSGKSVHLNRKTAKESFVEHPFIPVLGGIQPSILSAFYTEENKDSGFMDRMLLSMPEIDIEMYNEEELSEDVLTWYQQNIELFFDTIKKNILRNSDGEIIPRVAAFSEEAKEEWKRIFNEITLKQNDENENEYLKSMYPKQKAYIPRFCLLIHVFNEFFNPTGNTLLISKDSVLKAEKLSNYFVATAKKVKIDSEEENRIKSITKVGNSKFEQFKAIYRSEKSKINITKTATLLGTSRVTITKWKNDLDNAKV